MGLKKALLEGNKRVGVWGIGHIGYSTMSNFAERGVKCIGYDIDPKKVGQINQGEIPIFAMDYWLGFDPRFLYQHGVARATANSQDMVSADIAVHFICIPTEQDGKPFLEPLEQVCLKIAHGVRQNPSSEPPLVIIESTLTPTTTDQFVIPLLVAEGLNVGQDVLLGCAPRRDWFSGSDKSLLTLPRVFGGTDEATSKKMAEVLSIVCETLVPAPDHLHAEMVKSIENAYRHTEVALAFELSRAYPDLDMRAVLQLVGTKWNVGTFYPSFGVGGYCIPLSSHYVIQGARHPKELKLLQQTVEICEEQPVLLASSLIKRGVKRVAILGLSYTQNVKVWAQSPTIRITSLLRESGIEVKVHDPYYSRQEIRDIAGAGTFQYPEGLNGFDTVLVVSAHREYRLADHGQLLKHLTHCRLILDNPGLWQDVSFDAAGIEYHVAGDASWLNGVRAAETQVPAHVGDGSNEIGWASELGISQELAVETGAPTPQSYARGSASLAKLAVPTE